jgi:hypothetical protein
MEVAYQALQQGSSTFQPFLNNVIWNILDFTGAAI